MQENGRDPRILVVGAGPVGLTAALELARRGFRPRIIDKEPGFAPVAESRALAVNVRSLLLLEPSGVTPRIVAEARQLREMRMLADRRPLLTIDTMATDGRYRGIHALPQGRTERILGEALAAYGVAPEWNVRCAGIADPDRPVVTLEHAGGRREEAAFDIVIGADGAHSTVRKAIGVEFPGEALTETFYLADYLYDRDVDTSFGQARFFDPGVLARLPVGPRTLRYVSTLPDYRERIDHPAPIEAIPWESTFRVSFRHVSEMRRGKVFLAGDAAHIHSPVGGRGMNLGIEDACWLAWLIEEGRADEYTALRMPAVKRVMADTRQNTRMILLRNPLLRALRNLLVPRLARLSWVRQEGLRGVLGLDTAPPPWLADR